MRLSDVISACMSFGNGLYTIDSLTEMLGGDDIRRAVRKNLWKLEAGGLISRVRHNRTSPSFKPGAPRKNTTFTNTRKLRVKAGAAPSPKGENTDWDKLWKAARIMRRFTLAGLAGITEINVESVRYWARMYRQAGWIKPVRKGGSGVRWIFVKNPPAIRPYYGGKKKERTDEQ